MITMWELFGFMIMLRLAIGSCTECKKVDVIEGGNASLLFTASGLTFFYEIHCEERTKITKIGQYCGPADNCSNMSTTGVSIETGHLIISNVTYNRCYSAIPDKNTPGNETCYNVTVSKLHSQFTSAPRGVKFDFAAFVAAVAAFVVVIFVTVILVFDWDICRQKNVVVNANEGSHEEINMGDGTPEADSSLLTTVNETQL